MNYEQDNYSLQQSHRDPSLLGFTRIWNTELMGVVKHQFGCLEADAMFSQIPAIFFLRPKRSAFIALYMQ